MNMYNFKSILWIASSLFGTIKKGKIYANEQESVVWISRLFHLHTA